jgi:hypothetical protein
LKPQSCSKISDEFDVIPYPKNIKKVLTIIIDRT